MKNGAIYVRVSTDEQAREGYSIDAQIKAIKDYATKNNIYIDPMYIYKDEGISGRKAEKRPAFMDMIARAKTKPKPFDVILVHKFDRFSRNREDSIVYKSLLKKECNISVLSISEPLDPDDKMSIILEAFLEAMAEYYSINLSEEVKKGMLEKHSLGELQTCPSYGYDAKDNILVINENEAKIVKYIFEEYGINHTPMIEIARNLYKMGIKTKKGKSFENRTICYILNNPVYIGKLKYTPGTRKAHTFDDPNTILVDGKHSPIISMELWNKVQQELMNTFKFRHPNQRDSINISNWLKGIVRCKECGYTMVLNGKYKLRCNGYGKGKCFNHKTLDIEKTKELIINQLQNDFSNGIIEHITINKTANKKVSEYEILQNTLNSIKEKEKRIKEAYLNGIDSIDEYKLNKKMLEKEKTEIENKLHSLNKPDNKKNITKVIENGKKVYDLLIDESIPEDKKNFYARRLFDKIIYNEETDKLEIYYNGTSPFK